MGTPSATSTLSVTFAGHATVLLEMDGVRLLTDPLLRKRIGVLIRRSPVPPPAVRRDLDAVLISHAHLDHLDVPSLRLIDRRTPVVAPRGVGSLLRRLGFVPLEMDVGDEVEIGPASAGGVSRLRARAREGRPRGPRRHPLSAGCGVARPGLRRRRRAQRLLRRRHRPVRRHARPGADRRRRAARRRLGAAAAQRPPQPAVGRQGARAAAPGGLRARALGHHLPAVAAAGVQRQVGRVAARVRPVRRAPRSGGGRARPAAGRDDGVHAGGERGEAARE